MTDGDNLKPQFDLARVYRLLIDAYLSVSEIEDPEVSSDSEPNKEQKVVQSCNTK